MVARQKIRQAVVIVHGMGEHRPLDTLNGFINAGLPPIAGVEREDQYYSRPDEVTDSFEERRYLAPRRPQQPPYTNDPETYAQTEFFEYHWAHLMQGNKFSDLWPAFTHMLLRTPRTVPNGLLVVWALFWILIAVGIWFFVWGPGKAIEVTGSPVDAIVRVILGTGLVGTVATFLIVTVLGGWLTSSFVDVVRYLDTSPRSYAVRHDIRKGILDQLRALHESGKYQRIIIVAHSLGSYIAHDAITFLWGTMNNRHAGAPGPGMGTEIPAGLEEVEQTASALADDWERDPQRVPDSAKQAAFWSAQRTLWRGIRENGNPWLITDLITLGSPMYFADRLYTSNIDKFRRRVGLTEFPTCPPQSDPAAYNNIHDTKRFYSYRTATGRRVLYHGAPFAVVRWTNMWFPAHLSFFGDWFGGRLSPLYGPGIRDIELAGNRRRWTWFPAVAHAKYFSFPNDLSSGSVTRFLQDAMDLPSTEWLSKVGIPSRPRSGVTTGADRHSKRSAVDIESVPAMAHEAEPEP
jgi:hypothetical protein